MLGLLIGLLLAAAVVIALVIATSTSTTIVHLRTTFSHDVNKVINQLSNLINQYTK
jgi:hypothetical protein